MNFPFKSDVKINKKYCELTERNSLKCTDFAKSVCFCLLLPCSLYFTMSGKPGNRREKTGKRKPLRNEDFGN